MASRPRQQKKVKSPLDIQWELLPFSFYNLAEEQQRDVVDRILKLKMLVDAIRLLKRQRRSPKRAKRARPVQLTFTGLNHLKKGEK